VRGSLGGRSLRGAARRREGAAGVAMRDAARGRPSGSFAQWYGCRLLALLRACCGLPREGFDGLKHCGPMCCEHLDLEKMMEVPGRATFLALIFSVCCSTMAPPTNSTLSLEVACSSKTGPAFSGLGFAEEGRPAGRPDPAGGRVILFSQTHKNYTSQKKLLQLGGGYKKNIQCDSFQV
jgi:hypothetical protein